MGNHIDISHDASAYGYGTAAKGHHHAYLLPAVEEILASLQLSPDQRRIFDLGCGNGSATAHLARLGFSVVGIDPSSDGIRRGREEHPGLEIYVGSAYDDLEGKYGRFPIVISLEVVEHLYSPRKYAATIYDLVEAGGVAIISTPYHGYLKNLALAIVGKWDAHLSPLWDHGHIKFWSVDSLSRLLWEAGFKDLSFKKVGRIPPLAKSMIAIAWK